MKNQSFRQTASRKAVLEVIGKAKTPLDIAQILEELKRRKFRIDRATVFRIIKLFTTRGIINKLEFREGKARYELATLPHHHHAVCLDCGLISDINEKELAAVDMEALEKQVSRKLSFKTSLHSLELFGLCQNCS